MLFSSMFFLWIFLPVVLICYNILPAKTRNAVLLSASLFFYAFGEARYLVLLLAMVAIHTGLQRRGAHHTDRCRGTGIVRLDLSKHTCYKAASKVPPVRPA